MDKIYKRELFSQIKPYLNSPEAIVVTGMRRTGKTFEVKLKARKQQFNKL